MGGERGEKGTVGAMPVPPASLPSGLDAPAFTVGDAMARGVTLRRLRARDLAAPFRGARTREAVEEFESRARALYPLLSVDQVLSHTTAATLHGLPLPRRGEDGPLHVTTLGGGRAMRRDGVVGHRAEARAVEMVRGLSATSPLATWCDLATMLPLDDLIAVGDSLVRRKGPIATTSELVAAVEACQGRGVRRLREALALVRPNTDSARETLLRLATVRAGFPEPIPNMPIRNEFGVVIAHGDLVWPAEKVVLEYEGEQHATDPRQFAIDIERINELEDLGWRVIRVDRVLFSTRATLFARLDRALRLPR